MITITAIKLILIVALCFAFGFVAGIKTASDLWNPEAIERNIRRNALKAEINELKAKMEEINFNIIVFLHFVVNR